MTLTITDQIGKLGRIAYQDGNIICRSPGGTSRSVKFGGTFTSETSLQVRVVKDGTSTPVSGLDWQIPSSLNMSGGSWDGVLTIPQGGWYNFQVRDFSGGVAGTTVTNTRKWGVGSVIMMNGQSNMARLIGYDLANPDIYSPSPMARGFWSYGWTIPGVAQPAGFSKASLNDGFKKVANGFVTALGGNIPVGILPMTLSGSSLKQFLPSAYGGFPDSSTSSNGWLYNISGGLAQSGTGDRTASSSSNQAGLLSPLLYDGDFELVIWQQGENGSGGSPFANYGQAMDALWLLYRDLTGRTKAQLPIILVPLGNLVPWSPSATDLSYLTSATTEGVRGQQVSWCQTNAGTGAYLGPTFIDSRHVPTDFGPPLGYVHPSSSDYLRMATRYLQIILYGLGINSYSGTEPHITTTTFDSNSITIHFDPSPGTAIQDANGNPAGSQLDGWRFFQNSNPITPTGSSITSSTTAKFNFGVTFSPSDVITGNYLYGDDPGQVQWVNTPYKAFSNNIYTNANYSQYSEPLGIPISPSYGNFTATYSAGPTTTLTPALRASATKALGASQTRRLSAG